METKISIIKCSTYNQTEVDNAIENAINFLGGINKFVLKDKKILIKPNILLERPPEECVTTHPSIIRAVIKQVKKAGGIPIVGDSPGAAVKGLKKILKITGIEKAVMEEGGQIINLETEGIEKVKTDFDFLPYYYISKAALDADAIINLPKLKTHALIRYTGTIKNMFGVVPGMCKADIHRQSPRIQDFAKVLVHIFSKVHPILNIMDAVYGMEGDGPSKGNPRKIGYIFAGTDAVALDAVCSYVIGYKINEILTTILAEEKKIGISDLNNINTGDVNIDSICIHDFSKPNYSMSLKLPPKLLKYIYSRIKIKPYIIEEKCQQCLICVKHCPVAAITFSKKKFIFDYDKCIECFCCNELCNNNAIELKKNLLAKIILSDR